MAENLRRVAVRAIILCIVLLFAGTAAHAQSNFSGGTISAIRVEGVQRIEPATVTSYLKVREGDAYDPKRVDESLKSLFATGLFADVALRREGDTLVVTVVENPIINRIAFEGNDRIDDDQLSSEIQLKPRVVYTRTRVQKDVERLQEIYRRSGRFAATIEPKVVLLDQNRVDLVFEINEGELTKVRRITFIGNEAFDDGDLKEEIRTREARWYRFLTSDDTYDQDRVAFDRELLRRFYLARGYADFRVVSSVAELTPDRKDFFITFTVEEGPRYHFGDIDVTTQLPNVDTSALQTHVTTREGDWYNSEEVEKSIDALTQQVGDLQYAFVDIKPKARRDRENLTIGITYEIAEGPRVFVERIDINGNVRTLDEVVRREMELAEGDPFNATRLNKSQQKIRDLGFFKNVDVTKSEGTAPDQMVIDVDVEEQPTGELTIGAGYSTTDGALADFRVRERNLLGKGQDLAFSTTLSGKQQLFDASFTEPYFLNRDLSAGVDVFKVTRDFQDESSFNQDQTGFGLRLGYPLSDKLRQRLYYRLEVNEISDVAATASTFIQQQAGKNVLSLVGQQLSYDTRNSRLDPTSGYIVTLTNDLAGVGGSTHYLSSKLGGSIFFEPWEEVVLTLSAEGGWIIGLGEDVKINNRFFLGGDTLRGFDVGGVGPRDLATDDALGGTQYVRGTAEAAFPIGLPDELGVQGHLFTDAGSLGVTDDSGPFVTDKHALRVAVGAGLSWRSPVGPIRFDFTRAVVKENYDKVENFRFSFGTRF